MQAVGQTTYPSDPLDEPTSPPETSGVNGEMAPGLSQTTSAAEAPGFAMLNHCPSNERGARSSEDATDTVSDANRLLRRGQITLVRSRRHPTDGDSRCFANCQCRCHFRQTVQTQSDWLKAAFGALTIHSQGPLISPRCDDARCRGSQASALSLRYQFPSWLLARGVDFKFERDPVYGGPTVALVIPLIVSSCDEFWSMIRDGNTAEVKQRMVDLRASSIVDENGTSPLYVSQSRPRPPSRRMTAR